MNMTAMTSITAMTAMTAVTTMTHATTITTITTVTIMTTIKLVINLMNKKKPKMRENSGMKKWFGARRVVELTSQKLHPRMARKGSCSHISNM
ncbi:hypothetical protein N7472_000204 [Penicillium cf. griseofulvum]|uniref:Uncharacterized protein n=1 Tax=Penicillium cf. griseofulvum TaxID=2972120 RepID=A0A9W9T677_9EURO|nr:hypothetical protein N7472_000204 [Penicillium cf. griseofulvum]KAJ5424663.1 hypothetical protein N7445_010636 [Penicillium cf. griseofulvum]